MMTYGMDSDHESTQHASPPRTGHYYGIRSPRGPQMQTTLRAHHEWTAQAHDGPSTNSGHLPNYTISSIILEDIGYAKLKEHETD